MATFDPYHKWLGIPKDQRPPTFYQLLGIDPAEQDADVINEAAIRQTAHVRTHQIGPHAVECTRVLNEIAQARTTILNPAKRKEYDSQLAKRAGRPNKQDATAITSSAPAPQPFADFGDVSLSSPPSVSVEKKNTKKRSAGPPRKEAGFSKPMLYGLIGGGVGLVVVVIMVLALSLGGSKRQMDATVIASKAADKGKQANVIGPIDGVDRDTEEKPNKLKPPSAIPPANPPSEEEKSPQERIVASATATEPPRTATFNHYGGDAPDAAASLSPDGKLLAIAGPGRHVILVDLQTRKERTLAPRALSIHKVLFVKDATHLLAAAKSPNEALILYTLAGEMVKKLAERNDALGWTFLSPAPDKQHVFVGGTDSAAHLWNFETGLQVQRYSNLEGIPSDGWFSPDGVRSCCLGTTPKLCMDSFDTRTGAAKGRKFDPPVSAVTVSADVRFYIVASTEGFHKIQLATDANEVVAKHQALVKWLAVSNGGALLAAADESGRVSIWNLSTRTEVWRRSLATLNLKKIEFVKNDRALMLTGNGVDIVDFSLTPDETPSTALPPGTFAKHFIDPNGDCKLLSANESEGSLRIWAPGTPHDLYPGRGIIGPRMLLDVDGDCTAQVRVKGNLRPETNFNLDPKVGGGVGGYRAACLLIWYSDDSFFRYERGYWGDAARGGPQYNLTGFQKGRLILEKPTPIRDEDITLRLTRVGNVMTTSATNDPPRKIQLNAPRKLKVGVGIVNVATEPLEVLFEEFKVTTP